MSQRTRVVKVTDDGRVTFWMPDMIGRYLIVEEQEGQIVLSPYDLRWQRAGSSIAKVGAQLHFVPCEADLPPAA